MRKLFLALSVMLFVGGCSDATMSSIAALGKKHKITLWSGGQAVATYTSTGKVISGDSGTRFAFEDDDSGMYIRVTGNVTVEQVEE